MPCVLLLLLLHDSTATTTTKTTATTTTTTTIFRASHTSHTKHTPQSFRTAPQAIASLHFISEGLGRSQKRESEHSRLYGAQSSQCFLFVCLVTTSTKHDKASAVWTCAVHHGTGGRDAVSAHSEYTERFFDWYCSATNKICPNILAV